MMAKEYIDRIDKLNLFYLSFYIKRYFQWANNNLSALIDDLNVNSATFEKKFQISFLNVYSGILSTTIGFISVQVNTDEGSCISSIRNTSIWINMAWNRQVNQRIFFLVIGR